MFRSHERFNPETKNKDLEVHHYPMVVAEDIKNVTYRFLDTSAVVFHTVTPGIRYRRQRVQLTRTVYHFRHC